MTTAGYGGFSNQVIGIINLLYLAQQTNRVAIMLVEIRLMAIKNRVDVFAITVLPSRVDTLTLNPSPFPHSSISTRSTPLSKFPPSTFPISRRSTARPSSGISNG